MRAQRKESGQDPVKSGGLAQSVLAAVRKMEMIRPGDRVSVAVSGGADSVALLLLLLELREKLGIVLSLVHFNHKLRGRASDADETFVAKLAVEHGLEFHAASMDVAKKAKKERANLEDTGRRARYDYFHSLVEAGICTRVAVAHTADDQAETVLAHLLRGTGLAGLGGIHPIVGGVIRPLLNIRRGELRAYLRAKKQRWREDATNRDTARMRARIRKKLLPMMEKQFQPAIVDHLTTLAKLAREDEAYLEGAAELRVLALAKENEGEVRISAVDLASPPRKPLGDKENKEGLEFVRMSQSVHKRMVRKIVTNLKPDAGQLGARHVQAVLELAHHGRSGSSLALPGGVAVRKERQELVFLAMGKAVPEAVHNERREFQYNIDLACGSEDLRVPELGCVFRLRVIDWPCKRGETSTDRAVLDRERLRLPVVLRNWRPGDRMRPLGHRNAQKLKRLLNERHVSRWERNGWPVLTSGGVLAWARGFPVAAEFAADERTRAGIVIAEEQL